VAGTVPAVAERQTKKERRPGDRPPRGAVIVVVVGLIATLAAAALANENLTGPSARLEWVQIKGLPDSKAVPVPGGPGEMQLADVGLRTTGTNISGYSLFRSAALLTIDAGSPVGEARIKCSMRAPGGAEAAPTPGSRATYPRSSEELAEQPVPEVVLVEFASHDNSLASVEVEDLEKPFASEPGVKLEWPTYKTGDERLQWFLPPGRPAQDLELPFYVIWRTTKPPAIKVSCSLTTSAGTATTATGGAMAAIGEPIAEEEEE
jgi:hypothetical protein